MGGCCPLRTLAPRVAAAQQEPWHGAIVPPPHDMLMQREARARLCSEDQPPRPPWHLCALRHRKAAPPTARLPESQGRALPAHVGGLELQGSFGQVWGRRSPLVLLRRRELHLVAWCVCGDLWGPANTLDHMQPTHAFIDTLLLVQHAFDCLMYIATYGDAAKHEGGVHGCHHRRLS